MVQMMVMYKAAFQIAVLLTLFQFGKGQTDHHVSHTTNYIDSIQDAKQIEDLILKVDKRYKAFTVNESLTFQSRFSGKDLKKIADSLNVQPWTKADFDHNGLTDMLVVGNWTNHAVICILDKDGAYEIKHITRRSFQDCTFPVVENHKIKYFFEDEQARGKWDETRRLEQVTLIYKFGDFIEENPSPANHKIEKIEYSTTGCFGICPVFNMTINANKKAEWHAVRYNQINNKKASGSFTSNMTDDAYNDIVGLLNYIDFETLQDDYAVNWTDDQSSTLKITYDNGKVKSIQDYGLIGTYGLNRVNQLLFELRANQKWRKDRGSKK